MCVCVCVCVYVVGQGSRSMRLIFLDVVKGKASDPYFLKGWGDCLFKLMLVS